MSAVVRFDAVRAPVHGDLVGGPWSFAVERGAFLALQAAPSVADTVMALCTGSAGPEEGDVEVLGERPASLPRFRRFALLRRMGVAFQREGLVSNLSLDENLVMPLVFADGLAPARARAAADEAIQELGLEAHRSRRPAALTREARILAALARAALRRPDLLVLEHLTAGLPDALAARALAWCRSRSETILVLVPGPSAALDRLADAWLPPLNGPRDPGTQA
ncbi:MAG TPA: ATP-binding cassette domain-containing protein [Longimicrobiales bacterium]|nr:ATP-binding cassette domain-containing protein [Longimicrobiales bacterium]